MDASQGRDLMRAASLDELTNPEKIGGDKDDRVGLTQRILILTESAEAGGARPLSAVRREILQAYAIERTAGRHPLAFCNDLARCDSVRAPVLNWCQWNPAETEPDPCRSMGIRFIFGGVVPVSRDGNHA